MCKHRTGVVYLIRDACRDGGCDNAFGSGTWIVSIFYLIGFLAADGWTGVGSRSRKEKEMGTHNHVGFGSR